MALHSLVGWPGPARSGPPAHLQDPRRQELICHAHLHCNVSRNTLYYSHRTGRGRACRDSDSSDPSAPAITVGFKVTVQIRYKVPSTPSRSKKHTHPNPTGQHVSSSPWLASQVLSRNPGRLHLDTTQGRVRA